jgi:hypothetical protein
VEQGVFSILIRQKIYKAVAYFNRPSKVFNENTVYAPKMSLDRTLADRPVSMMKYAK